MLQARKDAIGFVNVAAAERHQPRGAASKYRNQRLAFIGGEGDHVHHQVGAQAPQLGSVLSQAAAITMQMCDSGRQLRMCVAAVENYQFVPGGDELPD
jgi:hypothetical protein